MLKKFIFIIPAILLIGCSNEPQPTEPTTTVETTLNDNESSLTLELESSEAEIILEPQIIEQEQMGEFFQGVNGTMVFYKPDEEKYFFYNEELWEQESSPCSTFKIISTLIGLEHHIITPDESLLKWNGTTYWNSNWNRDIEIRDAFKTSCIWYFREVINRLGPEIVQAELDQLQYGNRDISDWQGFLNTNNNSIDLRGFWVESSLEISPRRQAEVVAEIFTRQYSYQEENLSLLKEVMMIDETIGNIKVYGKTGTGVANGKYIDAWFTGFFETDDETVYFSIRLDDPDSGVADSKKAKEIALNLIENFDKFYQ